MTPEHFITTIRQFADFTDAKMEAILKRFEFRHIKKKTTMLSAGNVAKNNLSPHT